MKENWIEDGREMLFHISPIVENLTEEFGMKKLRLYHNNDIKHKANVLKRRRSKNKNKKTHRK